jgi:hypothetical protein
MVQSIILTSCSPFLPITRMHTSYLLLPGRSHHCPSTTRGYDAAPANARLCLRSPTHTCPCMPVVPPSPASLRHRCCLWLPGCTCPCQLGPGLACPPSRSAALALPAPPPLGPFSCMQAAEPGPFTCVHAFFFFFWSQHLISHLPEKYKYARHPALGRYIATATQRSKTRVQSLKTNGRAKVQAGPTMGPLESTEDGWFGL